MIQGLSVAGLNGGCDESSTVFLLQSPPLLQWAVQSCKKEHDVSTCVATTVGGEYLEGRWLCAFFALYTGSPPELPRSSKRLGLLANTCSQKLDWMTPMLTMDSWTHSHTLAVAHWIEAFQHFATKLAVQIKWFINMENIWKHQLYEMQGHLIPII